MSFEVFYDKDAEEVLRKVEFEIGKRIYEKIQSTSEYPFRFFKKLKNRPEFSLRVGKFRILAIINNKEKIIQILYIGNRENIYD